MSRILPVTAWMVLAVTAGRSVVADQIVVAGKNYPGATVVGIEQGRLRFLTAMGDLLDPWISDVEWMVVDRRGAPPDLNQAERFLADGKTNQAIERYGRALRRAVSFWTDVAEARLLRAAQRSPRVDVFCRSFVRVVTNEALGPGLAARLIRPARPKRADKRFSHALSELDTAIRKMEPQPARVLIELLRYDMLQAVGHERAGQAAREVAASAIPADARTEGVYAIVLTAQQAGFRGEPSEELWDGLDRAIRWCPESVLPSFLLLKGRARLGAATTREELIRAAWPFMRVAIHMRDDPRAAEGLLGASSVLERIDRPYKAVALLKECLSREQIAADVRTAAQEALDRLRSDGTPSG